MFKIDVWYDNYSQSQRRFQAMIPGIKKTVSRYQRGNQKRKLKKDRQYNGQKKKDKKQTTI